MSDAVIVSAVRTAVGTMGGGLSNVAAPKLGAVTIQAAIGRAGIPDEILPDEVLMGNVIQAGLGQNPARQSAIQGGLPVQADGTTIGGIGVGGASAAEDEQCAQAGIDALGLGEAA